MDVDYKHTWTLPRNSWVVVFYMWLWAADPDEVNFCKLFWGYVFAVPCLIVRAILFPFVTAWTGLTELLPEPKELTEAEKEERKVAAAVRASKRQSYQQRWLRKIEHAGSWTVMWITYFWRFLRYPVVAVAAFAALGGLVYGVYVLLTLTDNIPWPTWHEVVHAVWVGAIGCALVVVFMWLFLTERLRWIPRTVEYTAPRVFQRVSVPFRFFFWVMMMGFISVKSNTCPRVELTDSKTQSER